MRPVAAWCAAFAFAAGVPTALAAGDGVAGAGECAASFKKACVAADHPLASAAGAEMLAKGGNAVDAAVAASFALSVVRPFSCGIGGGGFMVIALPGESGGPARMRAIDYRETCPRGVGPDFFEKIEPRDPEASRRGGKAVATPGTIVGLLYALEKYGTLDRATVLAPAIRLAREGYAADEARLRAIREAAPLFEKHPEWKTRHGFAWESLMGHGEMKVGDLCRDPEQAAALDLIAREGAAAYQRGEIGKAVVESVRQAGGVLTMEDVRGFEPTEREPIRIEFLGRSVVTMPPPSSGGVALAQVLGIMERRGVERVVREGRWAEYAQDLAESFKHAFADRAEWLADPDFEQVPVPRLLSGEYLDARAATIQIGQTHGPEWYGTREHPEPAAPPADGGTSHVSVVDGAGGAVACTETINLVGGSLVCAGAYGFLLNDQMDDFTTIRGRANAFGLRQSEKNLPAPEKKPLSSMSPTIVLDKDGRVEAVAGASGGPRIITGTAQALLNALVRGMPAGEAVARARLHHQWMPNVLEVEAGYPDRWEGLEVPFWLRKQHHQVVEPTDYSVVQMIVRKPGKGGAADGWEAACDPRKGGRPAGE